ncbi:hypothetical protein QBC40DRAFT_188925, partial [Triangularia verruculosa]
VPPLQVFINTVLGQSQTKVSTILYTLAFIKRLRAQFSIITHIYPYSLHRIFLTYLILVDKYVNDSCYANYAWSRFSCTHWDSHFFSLTLKDITVSKKQLLNILQWRVLIVESKIQAELGRFLYYEAQC